MPRIEDRGNIHFLCSTTMCCVDKERNEIYNCARLGSRSNSVSYNIQLPRSTTGFIEMTEALVPKSAEHLVDIVLNRNEDMPSYALFLGAGASWNSGIKTANEMVEEWRRQLYEQSDKRIKYPRWLKKQNWYNSDEEYANLFGQLYDLPSQRRDFIEGCLQNAHPNWGYVYLSSLLEAQVFNTVFTTNFDDLINESCYLYSEKVRPIVCAHDSEVSNIHITRRRVKLIKLHGDFLFDSIRNIPSEIKGLERNMKAKLAEFGREYGLVVVGYGGRDNSVMSVLENLLETPEYYRHGIYWCIRKGETPRNRVQALLGKERVITIEIVGFDELMALIHRKAGIPLPSSLINPMQVAEQRSRVFCGIKPTLLENDIIRSDSERVLDGLGKVPAQKVDGKYLPPEELPTEVKAAIMRRKGDLLAALGYMKLIIAERKDDDDCAYEFADMLARLGKKEELKAFIWDSALYDENKTYFLLFVDDDLLIDFATKMLDKEPSNLYARINRAIAYKRLKKTKGEIGDLKILEELQPSEEVAAGVAALRKNKPEIFRLLDIALNKKLISIDSIEAFPVFEDYRDDEEFQEFLADRKQRRTKN